MSVAEKQLSRDEIAKLLAQQEGHFLDMKSKEIAPAKLSRSLSAFANSDGGELFVGVSEAAGEFLWNGFRDPEDANQLVEVVEKLFPLGGDCDLTFLKNPDDGTTVLQIAVAKSRRVVPATDSELYLRRGAQSLRVTSDDAKRNLERAKGITSHEDELLVVDPEIVTNSERTIEFILEVIPQTEPDAWMRKQQLLLDNKVSVAGLLLFADEPQVLLPKGAVKIYRYKTTDDEGSRETLAFDPIAVEGCVYDQVHEAVRRTVEITERISLMTPAGLQSIKYPHESLHEIITNAVLHRDYALNDDVHVRIFDNRVEVESPGRLPAHITPANILDERFARNAKIVRLINKFPNAPNKDVGEGLNTAFQAMKQLRLRDPEILERENSVLVLIRHQTLASPETTIVEFLHTNPTIGNKQARELTGVASETQMRATLKKLVRAGEIEQVPGTERSTTVYRIPEEKK